MQLESLELMARYNVWATKKLNLILQTVSDTDFFQDNGLFFGSIFATLNHLLVGEHYLWYPRFSAHSSAKPTPKLKLNTIIETDRTLLIKELEDKASNWLQLIDVIKSKTIPQDLNYQTSTGQQMSLPYLATLMHVFNHGTHHRGQITAALTAMGYACPELDLVYMLIDEKNDPVD